jgi:hypothetical protein
MKINFDMFGSCMENQISRKVFGRPRSLVGPLLPFPNIYKIVIMVDQMIREPRSTSNFVIKAPTYNTSN